MAVSSQKRMEIEFFNNDGRFVMELWYPDEETGRELGGVFPMGRFEAEDLMHQMAFVLGYKVEL